MAAWNSVIVIIVLFGLNCNGQFIPGQQLNAHEQVRVSLYITISMC